VANIAGNMLAKTLIMIQMKMIVIVLMAMKMPIISQHKYLVNALR
jgi:hypothetical protein